MLLITPINSVGKAVSTIPRLCSVRYVQNHIRGIYPGYYPTKNFCKFCRTFIPVPGTLAQWEHAVQVGLILRFKSNSSPESVYLRGYYPYKELLWVLRDIHTRIWNFCKICTPVPQYPGYGCSIFIPARNFCKFCTPVPQYPELLEVM